MVFALTHNYTGYPMIRQARAMVAAGELGEIRVVQVEYAQDWLTEPIEQTGQKQADWRTDPARSGAGGSTGDIGTHAFNLASFVTGPDARQPCRRPAELRRRAGGVDDNGHVLLRFEGGARGMLWCSQVAPGNENALRLRVYGTKGGLEWAQEDPNYLWFTPFGQPKRLITRGGAGSGPAAARVTPHAPGHPEGYLEGFANIYTEAARAIRARQAGAGARPGRDLSHGRGRRRRRRLRRCLRAVVAARRRLGHAKHLILQAINRGPAATSLLPGLVIVLRAVAPEMRDVPQKIVDRPARPVLSSGQPRRPDGFAPAQASTREETR